MLFPGDTPMSLGFVNRINEITDIEKLKKELSELEKLVQETKDPTSIDETSRRIRYIKWRLDILSAEKSAAAKE
jgi:hypothetical protein